MKIRWLFYFAENHLVVEPTDDKEDARIAQHLQDRPSDLLMAKYFDKIMYINPSQCAVIVRQEITEEASAQPPLSSSSSAG